MTLRTPDPTILGCLEKLRGGEITAVGVLADYLEEHGLPHASRLRKMWKRFQRRLAYFCSADLTRRKLTRWEILAHDRSRLRAKVARIFGRKWKPLTKSR